jgi:CRP/FNR family transcriptional activator FtrB
MFMRRGIVFTRIPRHKRSAPMDADSRTIDQDPQQELAAIAAHVPLLGSLSDASRERLIESARLERFAARALIISEGRIPQYLHIILSGLVEMSSVFQDRDCTALIISEGDMFMPAAVMWEEAYLVSARALTPVRLLLLDAETLRDEVVRTPALALKLARVMAGQWRVALRLILDLKCRSPSQRAAAFLLRLHDSAPTGTIAEIPFSKRQLASRIGMQPETLSRTLQTLADNGLYLRGRQIIVRDREAIERFCGPDPYPSSDEHQLGVHAL